MPVADMNMMFGLEKLGGLRHQEQIHLVLCQITGIIMLLTLMKKTSVVTLQLAVTSSKTFLQLLAEQISSVGVNCFLLLVEILRKYLTNLQIIQAVYSFLDVTLPLLTIVHAQMRRISGHLYQDCSVFKILIHLIRRFLFHIFC